MSAKQQQELLDFSVDARCPCAPGSLFECLKNEQSKEPCPALRRMLLLGARMAKGGAPSYLLASRIEAYVNALQPSRRQQLSVAGIAQGPADAPVTVVEFSDFECPACKRAHPLTTQLLKTFPTQVRLVFRNFPLPQHKHAKEAAKAASFAHSQGKFPEFAEAAFLAQTPLDERRLRELAREVGLDDEAMWQAVNESEALAQALDFDVAEGWSIPLQGTPTLFINGRLYRLPLNFEFLSWAVEDELSFLEHPEGWGRPEIKESPNVPVDEEAARTPSQDSQDSQDLKNSLDSQDP